MKLLIESSPELTEVDGVQCRVWHGVTESGVECFVLVHRLALRRNADSAEFDRELRELAPPKNEDQVEQQLERAGGWPR